MKSRAIGIVAAVVLCGMTARAALSEPVPAVFPVTVTASTLAAGVSYKFTFALYDAAAGGMKLWSESKSYPLPVTKKITHQLGSVKPATNPISPLLFDRQLWVEASAAGKIFPRVKLTVVPYAVRSEMAGNIEGQVTAGQVDATGAAAGDVLTADGAGAALWQAPAAGAGDIEAVLTPAHGGLQGGTDTGQAILSLLRTCAAGEVLKWNTEEWVCASDVGGSSGGTVTGVTAGAGLTGGTITTSGTIAVDTAAIQARVGGTCGPGNSIRVINADGTVVCEPDDTGGGGGTGWSLTGNAGTIAGTNFLGTTDSRALDFRVENARALRLEPGSGYPNLLGGYVENATGDAARGAAVGGGGQLGEPNIVTDNFGTVGGGANNRAGNANGIPGDATFGTVGGGQGNTASGKWSSVGGGSGNSASGIVAAVSGGMENTASGQEASVGGGFRNVAAQPFAAVAGGEQNRANGERAAIGGGSSNTVSGLSGTIGGGRLSQVAGDYGVVSGGDQNAVGGIAGAIGGGRLNQVPGGSAVVAGGENNVAAGFGAAVPGGAYNQSGGDYSLAAGRRSVVRGAGPSGSGDADGDEGTFVWSDGQGVPFTSTGPNQFLVQAQGGVGINTNAPSSALDVNGTVTAAGLRLTVTPGAGYVLTSDAGGNGSWQPVSGSAGGTVTQVDTGAGLTGGPITGTGAVSVATGGIANAMIADGAVTDAKITGPIATSKLEVGTAAGTVAAGDHAHDSSYVSKQGDTMNGPLNVSSASTTYNAGWFQNTNPDNGSSALLSMTNGAGPAVEGFATGTGSAGMFTIANPASAASALQAWTPGMGPAGTFTIANNTSTANALQASTVGSGYAGHFTGNVKATGTVEALRFVGDGSGLTNTGGRTDWQEITTTSHQIEPNKKYVVNNPGHVILTLPPVASLADTMRVTSVGGGGWTIQPNSGQRIVSNAFSPQFFNWLPGDTSRVWSSIASSADGLKLSASESSGAVWFSFDGGRNWGQSSISAYWGEVASSADGTKTVAVAYGPDILGGQIYTYSDGGGWTARGPTRAWWGVASSADGTRLVATADGGQIYTSDDSGITWTPRDVARMWRGVASSADGTKLVAVVRNGFLYTSTDSGATWDPRETGATRAWRDVASSADGTKLAAVVSAGQIWTSSDSGSSWAPHGPVADWQAVASSADGTRLAAVANNGGILLSEDSGDTWIREEQNRPWVDIASSSDGTRLVAPVAGGVIFHKPVGVTPPTPGSLNGGQYDSVELMAVGSDMFNIISHEGTLTLAQPQ